jgi:maltose alpha-D-glucosyltransferase/alpha-amylase
VLVDAFADPAFCLGLVHCLATNATVPFPGGELRFESGGELPTIANLDAQAVQHVGSEPTNASIALAETLFLKAYRRVEPGPHPDVEMTRYLTRAGFRSIAALEGSITYAAEQPFVIAAVFAFVRHQGDAWTYTLNHLDRFAASIVLQDAPAVEAPHALFTTQMQTLGRRVGELHRVLAEDGNDPAFSPEPIEAADLQRWHDATFASADAALTSLQRNPQSLGSGATAVVELIERREFLFAQIRALCARPVAAVKTRCHGNLHLGKVLLVADDLLITGFEGDASLPIAERRVKDSPLRDVATLLRSFDYARATALERATVGRPDLRERLEPALQQWVQLSSTAFLRGYRDGVKSARCIPADETSLRRLLMLFQVQRALRDVRTELDKRPNWVSVPAQALLTLLATGV